MEIKNIANELAGLEKYSPEYMETGARMARKVAEDIKAEILSRGYQQVVFIDRPDMGGVNVCIRGCDEDIAINLWYGYEPAVRGETFCPGCDTIEDVVDAYLEIIDI